MPTLNIGIVGSEGAKFTVEGEARAKDAIYDILSRDGVTGVVSGHCHLGGIDIWAEECGRGMGLETLIFPPTNQNWSTGYKPRNLQIAKASDIIYCISVDTLPPDYKGMTFATCYHCLKAGKAVEHVKSGGCWTVLEAMKLGKEGRWITIQN